jgi:hypothetical protein
METVRERSPLMVIALWLYAASVPLYVVQYFVIARSPCPYSLSTFATAYIGGTLGLVGVLTSIVGAIVSRTFRAWLTPAGGAALYVVAIGFLTIKSIGCGGI